jgi:hypothetical protein
MTWIKTAGIIILLALAVQGSALAQDRIVVDCNIFFNNNGNCPATEARLGTACPDTFNTCDLINTIFPNNETVDPQMIDPLNTLAPDFRVTAGGHATHLGGGPVGVLPNDGFFTQAYFVGAMGSGADEDWTKPWCYYSPNGAGRTDLPAGPPVVVSGNITTSTTWTNNGLGYFLSGTVRVLSGVTLTIQPGTVIFGEQATTGTLIIEQGAQIQAIGTPAQPIIMTSDALPGQQDRGQWGGLVLNGRAPVNCAAAPGGTCEGEGGSGTYGGSLPNDNSGTLRYVRIEFAGKEFSPDNELNALTQNGVGSGTTIDHVQTHRGSDDGIEWFGGTVNERYIIATDCADDHLDWQVGYRGKVQFAISRHTSDVTTADRGIEADNYEFGFDNSPRSNPFFANVTIVGTRGGPAGGRGITLRRGTAGTIVNSIIFNTRGVGIDLDDAATYNNCPGDPCALLRDQVGIAVEPAVAVASPLAVSLSPNPFNPSTQIAFTLSRPSAARVAVYDGNGRLVDEIAASGELAAGRHTATWNAPAGTSSGTYFYRVEAAGQVATGKMHLVK